MSMYLLGAAITALYCFELGHQEGLEMSITTALAISVCAALWPLFWLAKVAHRLGVWG
jgi:hypothetical protein